MGRLLGGKNKLSKSAKENIERVFNMIGGSNHMKQWAIENPTEFYKLYGKLVTTSINVGGSIGTYQAIPTEQRDSDTLASSAGSTIRSDTPRYN